MVKGGNMKTVVFADEKAPLIVSSSLSKWSYEVWNDHRTAWEYL